MTAARTPTLAELGPYLADGECHELAPRVAAAFGLRVRNGYYLHDDGTPGDHSWCLAPDGTIVDSTARQHGMPELLAPSDPRQSRYVSYEDDWPGVVGCDAAAYRMTVEGYIAYQGVAESAGVIRAAHAKLLAARR